MNTLTMIIFASDEGWGNAFYGTDSKSVFNEAWEYYHDLATSNDLEENEYVAKDILDFVFDRPDCIPFAECRYYLRITYINAPTDTHYADRIDWI